jgi:hypothetical protein
MYLLNLSKTSFKNVLYPDARARGRLGERPENLDKKELEMLQILVANGTSIYRYLENNDYIYK